MASNHSILHPHIAALKQILESGGNLHEEKERKIGLMYGITIVGIIFLSILGVIAVLQSGPILATVDFLVAFLLLGLLYLLRVKGYFSFCVYTGVTIMYCLYLYLFINGGIAGTAFLWSYTFPLFTFFLLGSGKGLIVSSIYFISCIIVLFIDLNTPMIGLYDKNLALRFVPSFAVVIIFALIYEKYRESTQQALFEAKTGLEKKVEERTRELLLEVKNRREKEDKLRVSEVRYRTLYDNSGDGISIISLEGKYLSANQQFCTRIGYTEDELQTKGPVDLYINSPEGWLADMLDKVLTVGSADFEAIQVTRTGSQIPVEIRAQRITFDDDVAVLCACRDISERKKREEENRDLQDRLYRASKMEAIGLMAGGIAHDLNNILVGVTGYPELLLLKLPQDSELRKPIEDILHSGRRAAAVVAELLTMARGVASAKEPHNCNKMIEQFLSTLEAKKIIDDFPGVEIDVELETGAGAIICSPIHFQKCIMNLLLNALEVVSGVSGARVEISTSRQRYNQQDVKMLDLPPGDYVIISVQDNGPGISDKDIDHIFEPFYSKKMLARSGTGLGLTVVWNVVHEHHGTISVKSSENGTTFKLFFPATDELEYEWVDQSVEWQEQHCSRILVVDDESLLRDVASAMLASFGYEVETVGSGEEAIARLEKENFDLVLLDMIMDPGMNGRETYEEIIKTNPGQKALIASGFSENYEVKRTLALGAGGFIKKPYSLNELQQAIQAIEFR